MTLTDRHWRALAARGVPADAIAGVTGMTLEAVEERMAEAEGRAIPVSPCDSMMTGLLARPPAPTCRAASTAGWASPVALGM